MKRVKLLVGFWVALLILGAVSAPTISAQALNGVWLKCMVDAKGYTVDSATGDYKKANGSMPLYLHFVYDTANSWYDVAVWTEVDGDWADTYDTFSSLLPEDKVYPTQPGENFIPDLFLQFVLSSTDYIITYHTPFIKFDKKGKVTYQGTGEVLFGLVAGGSLDYYGYFNIKGNSVDPSMLPFTP